MMEEIDTKKMHHRNGPETERQAAVQVAPRVTGLRKKALEALSRQIQGATGEELANIMDEWLYSVKPRMTELARMGLIEDSGRRKLNSRKRQEIIWQMTDQGRAYFNG
jgi:predicted ArsR family transcriptional regulator